MLWRKCKKFWSNKCIHALWVSNSIFRLKLTTGARVDVISQDRDELFPKNKLLRDKQ